jgi:hypothetical protein
VYVCNSDDNSAGISGRENRERKRKGSKVEIHLQSLGISRSGTPDDIRERRGRIEMPEITIGSAQKESFDPRLKDRTNATERIKIIPPPSEAPGSITAVYNLMDRKLLTEVQGLAAEAGDITVAANIIHKACEIGKVKGLDSVEKALDKALQRINYLEKLAQKTDSEQPTYNSCSGGQSQPCNSGRNSAHRSQ